MCILLGVKLLVHGILISVLNLPTSLQRQLPVHFVSLFSGSREGRAGSLLVSCTAASTRGGASGGFQAIPRARDKNVPVQKPVGGASRSVGRTTDDCGDAGFEWPRCLQVKVREKSEVNPLGWTAHRSQIGPDRKGAAIFVSLTVQTAFRLPPSKAQGRERKALSIPDPRPSGARGGRAPLLFEL